MKNNPQQHKCKVPKCPYRHDQPQQDKQGVMFFELLNKYHEWRKWCRDWRNDPTALWTNNDSFSDFMEWYKMYYGEKDL